MVTWTCSLARGLTLQYSKWALEMKEMVPGKERTKRGAFTILRETIVSLLLSQSQTFTKFPANRIPPGRVDQKSAAAPSTVGTSRSKIDGTLEGEKRGRDTHGCETIVFSIIDELCEYQAHDESTQSGWSDRRSAAAPSTTKTSRSKASQRSMASTMKTWARTVRQEGERGRAANNIEDEVFRPVLTCVTHRNCVAICFGGHVPTANDPMKQNVQVMYNRDITPEQTGALIRQTFGNKPEELQAAASLMQSFMTAFNEAVEKKPETGPLLATSSQNEPALYEDSMLDEQKEQDRLMQQMEGFSKTIAIMAQLEQAQPQDQAGSGTVPVEQLGVPAKGHEPGVGDQKETAEQHSSGETARKEPNPGSERSQSTGSLESRPKISNKPTRKPPPPRKPESESDDPPVPVARPFEWGGPKEPTQRILHPKVQEAKEKELADRVRESAMKFAGQKYDDDGCTEGSMAVSNFLGVSDPTKADYARARKERDMVRQLRESAQQKVEKNAREAAAHAAEAKKILEKVEMQAEELQQSKKQLDQATAEAGQARDMYQMVAHLTETASRHSRDIERMQEKGAPMGPKARTESTEAPGERPPQERPRPWEQVGSQWKPRETIDMPDGGPPMQSASGGQQDAWGEGPPPHPPVEWNSPNPWRNVEHSYQVSHWSDGKGEGERPPPRKRGGKGRDEAGPPRYDGHNFEPAQRGRFIFPPGDEVPSNMGLRNIQAIQRANVMAALARIDYGEAINHCEMFYPYDDYEYMQAIQLSPEWRSGQLEIPRMQNPALTYRHFVEFRKRMAEGGFPDQTEALSMSTGDSGEKWNSK